MPADSRRKRRSDSRPPRRKQRPARKSAPRPSRPPFLRQGPPQGSRPALASEPRAQGQRLQKVLAAAGLGSRRQCEELITAGRVEVDRQMVVQLGARVDPVSQEVRVDGVPLPTVKRLYYAVHKPPRVVSTSRDPSGRPRVIDLVPKTGARLFAVGRLDLNSEGLILVTNDGELADRLTHPRYGVEKVYRVQVAGRPAREIFAQMLRGVRLAEGTAKAERVKFHSHHKDSTVLEMVLREGQNREIRRLLAKLGHKVLRLTRIAVGPVRLGKLAPGQSRPLSSQELKALRQAVGQEHP